MQPGARAFRLLGMRYSFVLAAFLLSPAFSHACTCIGPNPVCSAYWQSPIIFRGRVLERIHTLDKPPQSVKNLDGTTSTLIGPGRYRVRFQVLETLRGEPHQQEITVLTNDQETACGFPFKDGGEYLVFTFPDQATGELSASKCTHTHALEAGKEDSDLSWMRALAASPAGATIFGSLVLPPGVVGPDRTSTVTIRGAENRDVVPDGEGRYAVSGLAPGKYTVSAVVPSPLVTGKARTVAVLDKGCAQVDWRAYYDGHIRGQVTDATGHPLAKVPVALERRDPTLATGHGGVAFKETDAQGHYDFSFVQPGDYLVAANPWGPSPTRPYPRVFYPWAESADAAASIHAAASATVDDINVTLPNAWRKVAVHARALLPDGSPAIGADVTARDVDYLSSIEPAMANAGVDGRTTVVVYEGRAYYLTATISGGTQQRCGGPLKFTAEDGLILEPIIIEHHWGNCLAQLNPRFRPPR